MSTVSYRVMIPTRGCNIFTNLYGYSRILSIPILKWAEGVFMLSEQ